MRTLLESLDLLQYWEVQSGIPKEILDFNIRERAKEKLRDDIVSKSKLRTYGTLRVGLEVGSQVKCLAGKRRRSLTTCLKCGTLPLRLETGRYNGESVQERLCLVCKSGEVESEFHFLFTCEAYASEREKFMESINLRIDNMSLVNAFKHPFALGGYVDKLWNIRQNVLQERAIGCLATTNKL